ncbi:hypothetical protein LAZ67_12000678 [Cordylochernes scorpioides]|uniref:Uncharacterized protein n=1 Tax=Cordylochernes scorpioides TaxID=51811 RepID=A0ABY6L0U7_9ARAC|nr:hypothetical protein LAZ67_12000678 [Cordylochernes scorpioides]
MVRWRNPSSIFSYTSGDVFFSLLITCCYAGTPITYLQHKLSQPFTHHVIMAWYYMCRHVVYLQYKLSQPSTHHVIMAWYYMCRHVVYLQYKLSQPSTHYDGLVLHV